MQDKNLDAIAQTPANVDRRDMLSGTEAGVLAFGALAKSGLAASASSASAQGISDVAIVSFAPNLEYFKAELYVWAVNGQSLANADRAGVGTPGTVTGRRTVAFATPIFQQNAMEIAQDEVVHVRLLRTALGVNRAILSAAADILAVEAHHACEARLLLLSRDFAATTQQASALRASLSGAQDDQGVVDANGKANIVPNDADSLVLSRAAGQVLNIVHGAPDTAGSLFFPSWHERSHAVSAPATRLVAVGAIALGLALVNIANAAVVSFTPNAALTSSSFAVSFASGSARCAFTAASTSSGPGTAVSTSGTATVSSFFGEVTDFSAGATIGQSGKLYSFSAFPAPNVTPFSEADDYVGFAFTLADGLHCGYTEVNGPALISYAYASTPNAKIITGAVATVPEPASVRLLLAGVASVTLARRRGERGAPFLPHLGSGNPDTDNVLDVIVTLRRCALSRVARHGLRASQHSVAARSRHV